tara:strand:+ start:7024 stop:7476 length:453 start_codon:yes stop_codon:yes gene_type:complete
LETFILVVNVTSAVSVIVLILLQQGKGADMGAAFGSGASGSLFGASGSANFLSRTTGILATVFFISTLGLTYLSGNKSESKGVMDNLTPSKSSVVEKIPNQSSTSEKIPDQSVISEKGPDQSSVAAEKSTTVAPKIPANEGVSKAAEIPK